MTTPEERIGEIARAHLRRVNPQTPEDETRNRFCGCLSHPCRPDCPMALASPTDPPELLEHLQTTLLIAAMNDPMRIPSPPKTR